MNAVTSFYSSIGWPSLWSMRSVVKCHFLFRINFRHRKKRKIQPFPTKKRATNEISSTWGQENSMSHSLQYVVNICLNDSAVQWSDLPESPTGVCWKKSIASNAEKPAPPYDFMREPANAKAAKKSRSGSLYSICSIRQPLMTLVANRFRNKKCSCENTS